MKRKSNKIGVEIIKEATRDFYGEPNPNFKIVSDFIRGKKNVPKLTKEQKEDAWSIRNNIADKIYRESIISSL